MQRAFTLVRRTLFAALVAAPAFASGQAINIGTGIDASGTPLAYGASDPFWSISTQGSPFAAAKVMYPAGMCCDMGTVDETRAKWITDITSPTSPATGFGSGSGNTAILRRQFDLTGYDLSTVGLSGVWRFADYFADTGHGFFLNGTRLFGDVGALTNWTPDKPFSIATGTGPFVAGVNTFEVRGYSVNSAWDGLYVAATVTGRVVPTTAAPEPASIALVATGVVLLAGVARRRRMR